MAADGADLTPADAPMKPKKAKPPPQPKVGMLDLLQFATPLDWLCISLAIPFAMLTGFLQVSFLFVFGPLMDGLGTTQAAGAFAPVRWGPCCGISMPLWCVQPRLSPACNATLPPLTTLTLSPTHSRSHSPPCAPHLQCSASSPT
jgi:hypothetical protein